MNKENQSVTPNVAFQSAKTYCKSEDSKIKSSATKVEAKFQELSVFIPQNTDNLHFKLEKPDSVAHSHP